MQGGIEHQPLLIGIGLGFAIEWWLYPESVQVHVFLQSLGLPGDGLEGGYCSTYAGHLVRNAYGMLTLQKFGHGRTYVFGSDAYLRQATAGGLAGQSVNLTPCAR